MTQPNRVLWLIPARGGSKGVKNKNLRFVGGVPLVGRAARVAREAARLLPGLSHRVVCSTDDAEIARAARAWGAEVPFERPAELAGDLADSIDVALHACDFLSEKGESPDVVALVQPTSPLARPEDLAGALRRYLEGGGASVVAVSPAPHAVWSYRLDGARLVPLAAAADVARRQDAGDVVSLSGAVFVASPDFMRRHRRFVLAGETLGQLVPTARAVDVDSETDLVLCDALLAERRPLAVEVGSRSIGAGHPCFVIAEAGVNHNGDAAMAHQLVDAAADAGADAVKFQTFDPDKLAAGNAPKAEYQNRTVGHSEDQRAMLRRLVLPRAAHAELMAHARERGLEFLSSPFDEDSADFLAGLGVAAFKIPSGELTNHGFLAHVARFGRPMLVSTGMCEMAEVAEAVDVIRAAGNPPLALFHCVSNYPTEPREANLRAIASLALAFEVQAGWSDHTPGLEISLAAVALGAHMVEKHLTLSRDLPGPDHRASLEPSDFASLVQGIRGVESALGDGVKRPVPAEAAIAAVARKSLHWVRGLAAGSPVAAGDLVALRPGTGVPPSRLGAVLGRRVRHATRPGEPLKLEELDPA